MSQASHTCFNSPLEFLTAKSSDGAAADDDDGGDDDGDEDVDDDDDGDDDADDVGAGADCGLISLWTH